MKYKLKRNFISKKNRHHFVYDDKYISNGHFLIERSKIINFYEYEQSSEKFEDDRLSTIFSLSDDYDIELKKTKYLYDLGGGEYARVFKSNDGKNVAINEKYVKHFLVEACLGMDENSPIKTFDGVIIMNVRLDEMFK